MRQAVRRPSEVGRTAAAEVASRLRLRLPLPPMRCIVGLFCSPFKNPPIFSPLCCCLSVTSAQSAGSRAIVTWKLDHHLGTVLAE